MTGEFPPPDDRLKGMVKVVQFPVRRDVLNVASSSDQNVKEPPNEPDQEIERLAKLERLAYDRERKNAANRLKIRVGLLDRLVDAKRGQPYDEGKQGHALNLAEPEAWPDPVDGAKLLDDVAAIIGRHVVMSDHAADAAALWVLHTHLVQNFAVSPRLAITSPEKGCGKTTLLDVLSHLVARPLLTANTTAAATFRIVAMKQPTLLIDEADTFLADNNELRGILNSGHRQGGSVIRIVGDDLEPRAFATYSACAIALIGKLPATLADRSVTIELRRRRPDEAIETFRFDRTGRLDDLARQASRWAIDDFSLVRGADPKMPEGVHNRAADNWRPLLAIADAVGGQWPERARRAARSAAAARQDNDDSARLMLLVDVQAIFNQRGMDRLPSADIIEALTAMENRPWAEFRSGKPISPIGLARLLSAYKISPGTIRTENGTPKGYYLADFQDAFDRYLLSKEE